MFATVILLRNLDINTIITNRVIDAEIGTGIYKHKRLFLPQIILTSSEYELRFILRSRQFPIPLAYCISINKGHGQILETVGLYFEY